MAAASIEHSIFPVLFRQEPEHFQKAWEEVCAELGSGSDLHQTVGYFPLYLKQRGFSLREQQIAYFESLIWLKRQEDHKSLSKNGYVRANPTLSPIYLSLGAKDLGREEGLYAIFQFESEVRVEKVNEAQAAVLDVLLDLLEHDKKMTWQQLVDIGTLESDMKVLQQKGLLEV